MDTKQFDEIIVFFQKELTKIKTGRANTSLIEDIKVEAYGAMMTLKEVAGISMPESRQFLISPYDKNNSKAIESALVKANLGSHPNTEGMNIRLILPPLTEETRKKEAVKIHQLMEEIRIKVREQRHKMMKNIQNSKESKEVQEKQEEEVDKIVKQYNEKIEELGKKKEEEVLKI